MNMIYTEMEALGTRNAGLSLLGLDDGRLACNLNCSRNTDTAVSTYDIVYRINQVQTTVFHLGENVDCVHGVVRKKEGS